MYTLIANDFISESRSVEPFNTPTLPETVAAPLPPDSFDLPADEGAWRVYILDYFKGLRIPEEEVSPLLEQILTEAQKRCQAILFFLMFTGAWERLAEWLTLAMKDAALETYIWNQRHSLTDRFRKNRRYRQDAEDIADNVIAEAIAAIRRGRRPNTVLKHWLSVIARNTLINHHRIESGQPKTIGLFQANGETDDPPLLQRFPDRGPSPVDQAIYRITWEELAARHSKRVADTCRYTAQGYTQKETAEKLGASDRTIRRWLAEAAPTVEKLFRPTG